MFLLAPLLLARWYRGRRVVAFAASSVAALAVQGGTSRVMRHAAQREQCCLAKDDGYR